MYYLLLTDSGEPECYEETMQVDTKKKWEQGMKEEMDSLENNQTWDLVQFPTGKRALQNKWVYNLKEEDGGEKQCYNPKLHHTCLPGIRPTHIPSFPKNY